ncbi:methyl-accepting chemotaxis protein [Lysinibacillus piscis]|uniref:Methyl-accepting chemotaxis protein n=1 Tax=Lysinibacillus piscis TaxID=2518931 RepID=A0ABQ5NNV1_9BACI|nr:HAMP domain-containing methyl-accepting chemotaxis protein [Lysinibacillus sp. KH24]GLC89999.1 hypothetical protein LYSBPC_31260 [Lysinibacillus sp. KH24]
MKIKSLLVSVIIITIVLFLINIGSFFFLIQSNNQQVNAFQKESTILYLKEQLVRVSDDLTTLARAYASTGDKKFYDEYMKEVNETQTYQKVITQFEDVLPQNLLNIVQNVQAESAELAKTEEQGFQLIQTGDLQKAADLMYSNEYFSGKEQINNYLTQFNTEVEEWISEQTGAAHSRVTTSLIILGSSIAFFSLFSLLASILIITKLKPLFTMIEQTKQVAQGNLTIEPLSLKEGAKDEISQLSQAFNHMFANLKNMLSVVAHSSIELSASTEELIVNVDQSTKATEKIVLATEEIANGSTTQLVQIEESSKAMSEVAQGIHHVATTASDVAIASEKSSNKAVDGGKSLTLAVTQMQQIEKVVGETMGSITSLSTRSQEIEKIVDAITDIADQTNLLALNAAIEAARAGEAGKGFAVVADEVRKLAEESSRSAQQITTIIYSIQAETQLTVQKMGQVNDNVSQGVEIVANTGAAFQEIITAARLVTDQIQEVSAVSQQMAASAEQVSATFESLQTISASSNDSTQQVAGLSEEQLASMEEISSATQLLNNLARELNDEVSKFSV